MAKLLKPSIVFLLVNLIVLANARQHDDDKAKSLLSFGLKQDDQNSLSLPLGITRDKADGSVGNAGENGCKCGDGKLREFMRKFMIILRAYMSKEFLPEVQAMAGKLGNFVMDFMAKEKPQQMDKINKFLENSAKITGNALGKANTKK